MFNQTRVKAALNSIAQANDVHIKALLESGDQSQETIEDITAALEDFLALEDPEEIVDTWDDEIRTLCIEIKYYCS